MVCLNTGIIDSHCHLDLEPLQSGLKSFLKEAGDVGVQGFIVPGVHPAGWPVITAVAAEYSNVMPCYGIHPMHAEIVTDQVLGQLQTLSAHAVAIGETGLDPSYKVSMEIQERVFRDQLRIAVCSGLPVLIHCRRAFQRTLKIMREEGVKKTGGIMHAYSGSLEMAHDFIQLGFAISISGTVTRNNAIKPQQIARELPLEHLVLETDAPDMTPERYLGTFNHPAWIMETARRVAEIRGISLEDLAKVTTKNVRQVLRLGGHLMFDSHNT